MKLSVYGTGYVGLVASIGFAKLGHEVVALDVQKSRIDALNNGVCPLYEVDLPKLLKAQLKTSRLRFTSETQEAINHGDIHIIAIGTPSLEDGKADVTQVYQVVTAIAKNCTSNGIIVIKSTVPIGTSDDLQEKINQILQDEARAIQLQVVSNPEFLREGTAVFDFLQPDRIIIGGSDIALADIKTMYQPLTDTGIPILCMSRRSAELTKYAANAMLACRISFINEISRMATITGANIDDIRLGIGQDHRIGPHFLHPGIGYGGSCFPKDIRALIQIAKSHDLYTPLLHAIEQVNEIQKHWVIDQLYHHYKGVLYGKTIGLWGLTFKPGTDDVREASSLIVLKDLLEQGVKIRVYDPVGVDKVQALFSGHPGIMWCQSAASVLGVSLDALVITTEWDEFKNYSLKSLQQSLGRAPLVDGRNCFDLNDLITHGFLYYYSVGRPAIKGGHCDFD